VELPTIARLSNKSSAVLIFQKFSVFPPNGPDGRAAQFTNYITKNCGRSRGFKGTRKTLSKGAQDAREHGDISACNRGDPAGLTPARRPWPPCPKKQISRKIATGSGLRLIPW